MYAAWSSGTTKY